MKKIKLVSLAILSLYFLVCVNLTNAQNIVMDSTFGDNGIVITPNTGEVMKSIVYPDESMLCVGYKSLQGSSDTRLVLAKYKSTGELDSSFADGGILIDSSLYRQFPFDADTLPDGNIIIVGAHHYSDSNIMITRGFVIRLLPDGQKDTGFAENGTLIIDTMPDGQRICPVRIVVLPDNKYLIGCEINGGSYTALFKINSEGIIDEGFANNGFLIFNQDSYPFILRNLLLLQDGNVLISGIDCTDPQNTKNSFIKISQYGHPVASFGNNGISVIDVDEIVEYHPNMGEFPVKVIELEDNRLLIGGHFQFSNLFLMMLNDIGSIDDEFGNNGIVKDGTSNSYNMDFTVQNNNKILVGSTYPVDLENDFGIFRYNYNGTRDATFNYNQIFTVNLNYRDLLKNVHFLGQNNVIAIGSAVDENSNWNFGLLKLITNQNQAIAPFYYDSNQIEIYPNPIINNEFHIDIVDINVLKFEIINITGSIIYESNYVLQLKPAIKLLPKGIYILRLMTENNYIEKKIVKTDCN